MASKTAKRIRRSLVIFSAFAVVFSAVLFTFSKNVTAITDDDITKKAMVNGLRKCVGLNDSQSPAHARWQSSYSTAIQFLGMSSLYAGADQFNSGGHRNGIYSLDGTDAIQLPTAIGNKVSRADSAVSCFELFSGGSQAQNMGSVSGLATGTNIPTSTTSTDFSSFMSDMGYQPETTVTTKKSCLSMKYKGSNGASTNTFETNSLCFELDENNEVVAGTIDPESAKDQNGCYLTYSGPDFGVHFTCDGEPRGNTYQVALLSPGMYDSDIDNSIEDLRQVYLGYGGGQVCLEEYNCYVFASSSDSNLGVDMRETGGGSATTATSYTYVGNNLDGLFSRFGKGYTPSTSAFTDAEKYHLYIKYFHDNFSLKVNGDDCHDNTDPNYASYASNANYIKVKYEEKIQWCSVDSDSVSAAGNDEVNAFSNDYYLDDRINATQLVSRLHDLSGSINDDDILALEEATAEPIATPTDPTNTGTGTTENPETGTADPCWQNAQSVGWILCPIKSLVQSALEQLYQKMIEPLLQVDPGLFGEKTFDAWKTFQTFANVIFVIILLIVIFSQLTGVGISNYGIKKMLPQLIVGAVLVNLSFIICELASDISNIAGNGLYGLFNGLANSYNSSDMRGFAGTLITGLDILFGAGGLVIAVAANGGIIGFLLMLLPVLISALIAVFFMFLLLSVRQAAIVILTVIAPVALVLYILPNTKKYFDKWIKAYSGLLLLYPICGAMIGGSDYAGSLLLSLNRNDMFFVIAAMLVSVVPYFFIPTILRNSFSAIGNIGNRIGQIGRSWSRGAREGIRRNESYRNTRGMARAGYRYNRNGELVKRRTLSNAIKNRASKSGVGIINRAGSRSIARGMEETMRIASADARAAEMAGVGDIRRFEATVRTNRNNLREAENAVVVAEGNVTAAQTRFNEAQAAVTAIQNGTGQPGLTLAAATLALSDAQDDLDAANAARTSAITARNTARTTYEQSRTDLSNARTKRTSAVARTEANQVLLGAKNNSTVQGIAERNSLMRMSKSTAVDSRLATLENDNKQKNIADIGNLISSNSFSLPQVNGGNPINPNDIDSLIQAADVLLRDYQADPTNTDIEDKLFAVTERLYGMQDPGRTAFNRMMHNTLKGGAANSEDGKKALNSLSSHIFSKYGGTLHSVDRGSEELYLEMSKGDFSRIEGGNFDENRYLNYGLGSYTAESLNGADTMVLQGMLANYKAGRMSETEMAQFEKLSYDITHDPNMKSRIKGKDAEGIFNEVAANHAVSRTASVDATTGRMTETRTLSNGQTSSRSINYTTRAGAQTSNIADVKTDYLQARNQLDSGISVATGAALTDAEKSNLRQTINETQDILERTDDGKDFIRQELTNTVAASAANNGGVAQVGEGTRHSAGRVKSDNHNDYFTDFARRVSTNQQIQSSEFEVRSTTPASGSAPATTTYNLASESAIPIQTMYDTATRQTVEVREVAPGVRESRPAGTSSGGWQTLSAQASNTLVQANTPRQVIDDRTNTVIQVVPLANGQTIQVAAQPGTPTVTTTEVINNISNGATTINNTSSAPATVDAARTAINDNIAIAATSDRGLEGLRDTIRSLATASAGAPPSEGLRYIASQVTPEVEAKLDPGTAQILADARNNTTMRAANDQAYARPTERVYDRYTETTYNRVQGVNGSSEYYDASGARVQVPDQDRIVNESQRSEQMQTVSRALEQIASNLQGQGLTLDNNGRFQRFKDKNGRNTELMYIDTRDSQGRTQRHFYNVRTSQRSNTAPVAPPTPPNPPSNP